MRSQGVAVKVPTADGERLRDITALMVIPTQSWVRICASIV
jgi:hypothetical protein